MKNIALSLVNPNVHVNVYILTYICIHKLSDKCNSVNTLSSAEIMPLAPFADNQTCNYDLSDYVNIYISKFSNN